MSNDERRGTSRSGFLKQAAGATIAVAGVGAGAGVFAQEAAAFARGPRQTISLDGTFCGKLGGAISGGDLDYDVLPDVVGSDHIQRKHLGQPKYEDVSLQIGSNMSKPMYQWIKDSMDHGYDPALAKQVAVSTTDSNGLETGRSVIQDALISSVTFPALDRSLIGKQGACRFGVNVASPSPPLGVAGSGSPVQARTDKPFVAGNFVLVIGGVDTDRVATIDSFTWTVRQGAAGVILDAGNLGITFDAASLPSWQSWFDSAASGASDERDGKLTIVGANGGAVITVGLGNLGIYRLVFVSGSVGSGSSAVRRCKAELYCEQMDFTYAASWS